MKTKLLFLFFIFGVTTLSAQLANTLTYDSLVGSPAAKLTDIQWIAGHWKGASLDEQTEEIWLPPLGNSMLGAFKLVTDGEVKFYEICTIVEENKSLVLRLKHFDPQLRGWEEKDKSMEFKLVKITPNRVFFDGFTFERVGKKELNIYVIFRHTGEEMKFNYKKK